MEVCLLDHRRELVAALKAKDVNGTGQLKKVEWAAIMNDILPVKLPWLHLAEKFVVVTKKGDVITYLPLTEKLEAMFGKSDESKGGRICLGIGTRWSSCFGCWMPTNLVLSIGRSSRRAGEMINSLADDGEKLFEMSDIDGFMDALDVNGDGAISFAEFSDGLLNHGSMAASLTLNGAEIGVQPSCRRAGVGVHGTQQRRTGETGTHRLRAAATAREERGRRAGRVNSWETHAPPSRRPAWGRRHTPSPSRRFSATNSDRDVGPESSSNDGGPLQLLPFLRPARHFALREIGRPGRRSRSASRSSRFRLSWRSTTGRAPHPAYSSLRPSFQKKKKSITGRVLTSSCQRCSFRMDGD